MSAGVSLLSTTSCVLTLLSDLRILPLPFLQGMVYFLLLFFAVALWMSFLGGVWLLLGAPSDDFGTLILRGRPVSRRTWKTALLVCYAAPWTALAVLLLCMIRM